MNEDTLSGKLKPEVTKAASGRKRKCVFKETMRSIILFRKKDIYIYINEREKMELLETREVRMQQGENATIDATRILTETKRRRIYGWKTRPGVANEFG